MPSPPDFIGVGAEGPGPAWWLGALGAHPGIETRGALRFFTEFGARECTDADLARYHAAFGSGRRRMRGEWSERYLADGWTPALLRRAAPAAKLLVMVSDPVERYRRTHVERVASPEPRKRLYMTDVVQRSHHAAQLRRLHRHFAREQVLVLQLERCLRDPAGEYARTLRFLGVRDDVDPPPLAGGRTGRLRRHTIPPAPSLDPAPPLWEELEAALHAALAPDVEELAGMVPELDLALWPAFAPLAAR